MARIGVELNLFEILTKNDDIPVNAKILAEQTEVDPILMSSSYYECQSKFAQLISRRPVLAILCVIRHDQRGR